MSWVRMVSIINVSDFMVYIIINGSSGLDRMLNFDNIFWTNTI